MTNFTKMFPPEYVQGYTAALQDVLSVLENIQQDLKRHHVKESYKTYKAIVECMLENRAILREDPDAFIRHNANGYFELAISNR